MAFIDGTNLFYRLVGAKLKLISLATLVRMYSQERIIVRAYLYTSEPHYLAAIAVHGESAMGEIRIVKGHAIPTGDGNVKEKGVDALLVADMIYHAAARNYDHAILISADQDFAYAIKRVEDFGCRTTIISVGAPIPALLRDACDEYFEADPGALVSNGVATFIK